MRAKAICLLCACTAIIGCDRRQNLPVSELLVQVAARGHVELVSELLRQGADPNHRNASNETPLGLAVEAGSAEVVKLLLDHGAEVDGYSGDRTPLIVAATWGHTTVAALLLKAGANPFRVDLATSATALHLADHPDVIQLLLDAGCDIGELDGYGHTPLHWAAFLGANQSIDFLIAQGVDVNAVAQGHHNRTPLHMAAGAYEQEAFRKLLEAGADPDAVNSDGLTPYEEVVACINFYEDLETPSKPVADLLHDYREMLAFISSIMRERGERASSATHAGIGPSGK